MCVSVKLVVGVNLFVRLCWFCAQLFDNTKLNVVVKERER